MKWAFSKMNFISYIGFDAFKMCAPHKKREYNSNYDLITHKKIQ